jgi:C4-dicarboxylate-specific signal transduction histidine kinase
VSFTEPHIAGDAEVEELRTRVAELELRVAQAEERRRALFHIMGDLNDSNKRLGDQRKAMLHILGDYEQDRSRLAKQTERLDNSRRALLHILSDSHDSNLRLESSRKAMIHIMGDLRETTAEIERREHELREKQEQLIQAGKLATLGELTTGIAHELNNPLNNIGLFIGNAVDRIALGRVDPETISDELGKAMEQVRKATEIISHLRTFGRAAAIVYEPVEIAPVIERSLSLMHEQLRLRQIEITVDPGSEPLVVVGNAIQLEQVFVNLLTNARDALLEAETRRISIVCERRPPDGVIRFADSGPGVPEEIEQRIFDPFFTTKEVGAGTGLGLSITYGIVSEHGGTIELGDGPDGGAEFTITLPLTDAEEAQP